MARVDYSRKWRGGMDALLIQMCESGEYAVRDIASKFGVTDQTVYPQMRRLGLPLLNDPRCKLRDYRSYGPRYNEVIFSEEQVALIARCNAEGWHDSKIAQELRISAGPVRKLRSKLGLSPNIRKSIPAGIRYGNLIVVKALSPKNKKRADKSRGLSSRSLCCCDCGRKKVVFNEDLRSGKTKTCGCRIDLRNRDSEWIRVFHGYRSGAANRGLKFALSLEQLKYVCSLPCHYCRAKESNIAIPPKRAHRSRIPLKYNGIDQVLPCQGYYPGNVLPSCYVCNRAKSSLPIKEFVSWINRLFKRRLTPESVMKAGAFLGKKLTETANERQ